MKAEEGRFLVSRRNLDNPSVPKKGPSTRKRAVRRVLARDDKLKVRTTARIGFCAAGDQCALSDSFTRVWSVIQFTSQVLPPSSEKDCSK